MSSEDSSSSTRQVTSSTTTTGNDGQEETITTVTTTENVNGDDVRSTSKLSKEVGETTEDHGIKREEEIVTEIKESVKSIQDENLASETSIKTVVEKQVNIAKTVNENGSEKVEEIQTKCKKVVDSVTEQVTESCSKTKRVTSEHTQKVDEKIQQVEGRAKASIDTLEKDVEGAAESLKKSVGYSTRTFVPATGPQYKTPLTITEGEKEEALYALNVIRSLHGLKSLVWNDELEKQAKEWALQLAEDKASAELSGIDSLGEIVYVAKGTSECPRMASAVLEWYKPVTSYNFNNTNLTVVSDSVLSFTQLVWDDTTDVGMVAVFREDTKTSYIVANFTPAGNYGDVRNYLKNVKQPIEGLPPKIPKPEDLVNKDGSQANISNMGSLFDVLCKWCVTTEAKAEVKTAAARPYIRIVVKDEDSMPTS